MVRLTQNYKDIIPKGNLRNVQKILNQLLNDVSVRNQNFYYQWAGFTHDWFHYHIVVKNMVAYVYVFKEFTPYTKYEDIEKLFYTLKRSIERNHKYRLSFDTTTKKYMLEYDCAEVKLHKMKKRKKKQLTLK